MTSGPSRGFLGRVAPWLASAFFLYLSLSILLRTFGSAGDSGSTSAPRTLRLAVAASLAEVMGVAVERWNGTTGDEVELVPGASSTLARQIQNGAPYDLFVSAHASWMDALVAEDLVEAADVRVLAENSLVVIAHLERGERDGDRSLPWEPGALAATGPRWALADPDHVPAGVYAKEALTNLGVWEALEPRVIATSDVRAALRLVERGEADYGVVYRTDVPRKSRVTVVADVPVSVHTPAKVILGQLQGAHEGADLLAAWLCGPTVQELLVSRGFRVGER